MSHGELLHIDEDEGLRLREQRPDAEVAATAAGRFRALGDPTRLTLALALRDGKELCVCDLSWISQRSQNLVSHHMKTLRAEGLVRARREGKMVMYSLTSDGQALLGASRLERPPGSSPGQAWSR
jgi:ArsR family transcriptional regulator, lead/cadmium/zinc/bismuth-responsive transcriptional repressor